MHKDPNVSSLKRINTKEILETNGVEQVNDEFPNKHVQLEATKLAIV